MKNLDDTIVAISTPIGEAGIGIVRMSGREAKKIGGRIFRSPSGRKLKDLPSHQIIYGFVFDPDTGEEIDEALLSFMEAPRTYTREDIVEINCHSGISSLKRILETVLRAGARLAEPGEFTRRAFLNGRIDLSQAEAVLDIIKSKTSASLKVALNQLEGNLSSEIGSLRGELRTILANLEAAVDFSDEDIEPFSKREVGEKIEKVCEKCEKLFESTRDGRIYREGIKTVIVGKPNVGKSSLLNALVREERAIVTPIPGTTRDVVEEGLSIRGIPLVLRDTAGIRRPKGTIETIGVELSRKSLSQADLALFVIDGSIPLGREDAAILKEVEGKWTIIVINKIDLPQKIAKDAMLRFLGSGNQHLVRVSALTTEGIEKLKGTIVDLVFGGRVVSEEGVFVTNTRHRDALGRTIKTLNRAGKACRKDLSEEFVAVDVREALDSLGEIVGETVTEDILDQIFNQFCIGK